MRRGQQHTEETKQKIGRSMAGKKFTDEHRRRLSESHLERWKERHARLAAEAAG